MPPRLTTQRLTLRAPSMQDWPAYQDMMASERAQYMGGPFDTFAAWGLFCHEIGEWALMDLGALMIDTSDGTTVGLVGLNSGPLFPEIELGWMLFDGFEGQGYAFEAAQALRDWGFGPRGLDTLVSYIDPENLSSQALARRLGAVLDPTAEPPDEGDLVFRHTKNTQTAGNFAG